VTLEETPKSQTGNAKTYALRKLRKDRPDLHERVSRNVPGSWSLQRATMLEKRGRE
jgi:hypothetical protein